MTFDYNGYDLKFIQKRPCKDSSAHQFSLVFKFNSPKTTFHYILHADYHSEDVFAIKFYCKKDRHSDYKYNKIINKGDVGNIFITCAKVIPYLLESYPKSSFGFVGCRTIDKATKKVESHSNTQRYKVYKEVAALKFGQEIFEHFEYEEISSYLLVNKANGDILKKEREIISMFTETYNSLLDIA